MCCVSEDQYIDIIQPKTYKRNLFPHQLTALKFLEERESKKVVNISNNYNEFSGFDNNSNFNLKTNVGIFADITGYGKTVAIIAMIIRDKMEWNLSEPYIHEGYITNYGDGRILATDNVKYERLDCNLILMNQSLIKQWEMELQNTKLRYTSVTTKKQISSCNPEDYDVVLISPTMYNTFVAQQNGNSRMLKYAWKRFIFDEPQCTQISAMKTIMAGYNWFITATPGMLLTRSRNRNNFLANMFHLYMHRNIFDALIIKNNDIFVRESYKMPETVHNYYETYQPVYNIMKGIANDNVTTMISAGNISGAIKLIGGSNVDNNANIFELLVAKKEDEIKEIDMKIELYTHRNNTEKIEKLQTKKRYISQQLTNLEQRMQNILSTECPICSEICTKPVMISGCCHIFCGECLFTWLKDHNTCPLCRNCTKPDELWHFESKIDKCKHDQNENKTKQQVIIDLVRKKPDGKFIIFSAFDETFIPIRTCLSNESIHFDEINGTKENRDRTIESFKKGDVNILFLNSTNNGAGLNFQEVTDIILYHTMSEQLQTQVIGRANRIGRKENLYVHHLN